MSILQSVARRGVCDAPAEVQNHSADAIAACSRHQICHEQPVRLTALPKLPTQAPPAYYQGDEPASRLPDYRTSADIARPPSIKPLDLGSAELMPSPTLYTDHEQRSRHRSRPSTSGAVALRQSEHSDGHRASLVPMKLGPVVLKQPGPATTSAPDLARPRPRDRSGSVRDSVMQRRRESYRATRETPFQRCQRLGAATVAIEEAPASASLERAVTSPEPVLTFASFSANTTMPSLAQPVSHEPAPDHLPTTPRRSTSERHRLKRKASSQSLRKHSGSLERVPEGIDQEISELNAIIEERRAVHMRPRSPEIHHIAAIAPAMALRARSETLNDIGSALARPLTAPGHISRLGTSHEPANTYALPTFDRKSSRVSGWLSGLLPSITPPGPEADEGPFYKVVLPRRPPADHDPPPSPTVTELESPTAASSLVSPGHTRSFTAESRGTLASPPSTVYDVDLPELGWKEADGHYSVAVQRSQVGLAL